MPKVFRAKFTYETQGQGCQNVLHYYAPDSATTAEDLATFLASNHATTFAYAQSSQVTWLGVTVDELLLGTGETHTVVITGLVGDVNNESTPIFVGYGFQKVVNLSNTRSGAMRLGGAPEVAITAGVLDNGYQNIVNAIAQLLASAFTTTLGTYIPVVIREEDLVIILNLIINGVFKRITTQNTRKPYTNSQVSLASVGRGTQSSLSLQAQDPDDVNDKPEVFFVGADISAWAVIVPTQVIKVT